MGNSSSGGVVIKDSVYDCSSVKLDTFLTDASSGQKYFTDEFGEKKDEEKKGPQKCIILGDSDKLTAGQLASIECMKETNLYPKVKVKRIALSFSGASVYFFTPLRAGDLPMPSSVVKLDAQECVEDEVVKTNQYGPLFGLTTPKVKDVFSPANADPNEPTSIMQIDLCGGLFGLPEFASAPPVNTFASLLCQVFKPGEKLDVDMIPYINESFERRMYKFSMSDQKIKNMKLSDHYKIVRFIGHGVLNRAKEGKKRAEKSPAIAAGFLNPADVQELDSDSTVMLSAYGKKIGTAEFYKDFTGREEMLQKQYERTAITGLCHGDLHGGNLLLDSQGLVWLIDFATVKSGVHVLMDVGKFLAACLFLYLEGACESFVWPLGKLLASVPDSTTALPSGMIDEPDTLTGDCVGCEENLRIFFDIVCRLRYMCCVYEGGENAPPSDGMTFILNYLSWSSRMLSYNEPNLVQKRRALYCSLCGAARVLQENGLLDTDASEWLSNYRGVWEGEKGRRLSQSALEYVPIAFDMEVERRRFLIQVGVLEAWSTDPISRQRVNVVEHCLTVQFNTSARVRPRPIPVSPMVKIILKHGWHFFQTWIAIVDKMNGFAGRMLVTGSGGTGKSTLTKQMFSYICQYQLRDDVDVKTASLMPLRAPLVEFARLLEGDASDMNLDYDPQNDLFYIYIRNKYGADSVHEQIVMHVRLATEDSTSNSDGAPSTEGAIDLLDGLDETSVERPKVLQYCQSLFQGSKNSLEILTSRPSVLGPPEVSLLSVNAFHSVEMAFLQPAQVVEFVDHFLERAQLKIDRQQVIDRVTKKVYKSLTQVPITLNLLSHVIVDAMKKGQTEVLARVDVYTKAINMMLREADGSKFAARDGAADLAMAKRAELIASQRSMLSCREIAWNFQLKNQRNATWPVLTAGVSDKEIAEIFKEAVMDDRMPLFEGIQQQGKESEVQFVHLSFQEIFTAEFCVCTFHHAVETKNQGAYFNVIASSDPNKANRDRLSTAWWIQVWLNISDFHAKRPERLKEWCDIMGEDKIAKITNGVIYQVMYADLANYGKSRDTKLLSHDPQKQEADMKYMDAMCGGKVRLPFSVIRLIYDGVGYVFRVAAEQNLDSLLRGLAEAKVHYALGNFFQEEAMITAVYGHANASMDVLLEVGLKPHALMKSLNDFSLHNIATKSKSYYAYKRLLPFPCQVYLESLGEAPALNMDTSSPDFNVNDMNGKQPLTLAVINANASAIDQLLSAKAAVDATPHKATALTFAAISENVSIAQKLIEGKANVKAETDAPLQFLVRDVFGNQHQPMHAPSFNDTDMMRLLLDSNTDVHHQSQPTNSSWCYFCIQGVNKAGIELLIERKIRVAGKETNIAIDNGTVIKGQTQLGWCSWLQASSNKGDCHIPLLEAKGDVTVNYTAPWPWLQIIVAFMATCANNAADLKLYSEKYNVDMHGAWHKILGGNLVVCAVMIDSYDSLGFLLNKKVTTKKKFLGMDAPQLATKYGRKDAGDLLTMHLAGKT